MKIIYIAHPIGAIDPVNYGDAKRQVSDNLKSVADIVKFINITYPDIVPLAPYYLDCIVLDDSDPVQRQRGINNDIAILKSGAIKEIWLYGDRISKGMKAEIILGLELGIKVVAKTKETITALSILNAQLNAKIRS